MKRLFCTGLIILFALSLIGCTNSVNLTTPPQAGEDDELGETTVRELVTEFGKKLQMVSLLAPEDILSESLEENYGGLVSPALLEEWMEEPSAAPGRLVSSPWPDRIEVTGVEKVSGEGTRL